MEFIQSSQQEALHEAHEQQSFNISEFITGVLENPAEFDYIMVFGKFTQEIRHEIFAWILAEPPETPFIARLLSNLFRTIKLPHYEDGLEGLIGRVFEIFLMALEMIDSHENIGERCELEVDFRFAVVDFIRRLLENNHFVYTDELPDAFDNVILRSDLIDILDNNPEFIASEELIKEGITSNRIINSYILSRKGINDVIGRATRTDTLVGLLSCSFYLPEAVNILIDSFASTEYMYIYTSDFYDAFANIVNMYMSMSSEEDAEEGISEDNTNIIHKLIRIVTMLVNSNTPISRIDYELARGIGGDASIIQAIFAFSNYIDQQNASEEDVTKHLPGISKQIFFRFAVYAFINNMFEDVSGLLASEDENEIFVGVVLMILRKDYDIFALSINHVINGQMFTQGIFEFLNTISRSGNQTSWTRPLAEMLIANPAMFTDIHFGQMFRVDEFAFEDHHLVDRYATYVIDNIESLTQSPGMIMKILMGAPIKTPTILRAIAMLT